MLHIKTLLTSLTLSVFPVSALATVEKGGTLDWGDLAVQLPVVAILLAVVVFFVAEMRRLRQEHNASLEKNETRQDALLVKINNEHQNLHKQVSEHLCAVVDNNTKTCEKNTDALFKVTETLARHDENIRQVTAKIESIKV